MKFPFLLQWMVWLGYFNSLSAEDSDKMHFTNSWAVHIENGSDEIATQIAERHGFYNIGQIGSLSGYFHFIHEKDESKRKRREVDKTETLLSEEKIKWVEQQHILERDKRSVVPDYIQIVHPTGYTIQDPLYNDQWYLNNVGQSSGPSGLDINVLPVWSRGISGKSIVVAVLDDGLDHTHPDLKVNYDPRASYDFNDYDEDPMPRSSDPNNCHGTKCAGEVAAEAGNGICGVGVAFNCSIGGIRMLDGNTTDTIEGSALSYKKDYIDIYSCAWGPKDDGKRFGRPGILASKALELGAKEGRKALGSIFVWATGNGGLTDDDCNCDGYTTSVYTVSVGAISDHGLSTYYTESCASTLAVTYSGGSHREKKENKIVTTTLNHKCTDEFKGTSSAAPLASGMIALMLEANGNLTWRDVQHIIVETSLMTSPLDEGWRRNGAGKWFNQKFGFGRMDASAMVDKAESWVNLPDQRICYSDKSVGPWNIPSSGTVLVAMNTTACSDTTSEIKSLEHVQVILSLNHRHRGHVSIELISPSGTRTQLLKTRRNDKSTKGLKDWVFMSVHFWGEDPKGIWTLAVTDNSNNNREHHREKSKYGDLEDATEALQDEIDPKSEGDLEHEKIVDDEELTKTSEEFENSIFKDDSFRKKNVETKTKNDKVKNSKSDHGKLKTKQKRLKNVQKKKGKRKKEKFEDEEGEEKIVEELIQQSKSNNEQSVADGPNIPISGPSGMNISSQYKSAATTNKQVPNSYPTYSGQNIGPVTPKAPVLSPPQFINSNTSQKETSNTPSPSLAPSLSNNQILPPPSSNSLSSNNTEANTMLENVLKTVLSETFNNFRTESGGFKNFEERLSGLEAVLYKNNTHVDETVSASLLKAFKDGKAIDKINNVLGVLENSKNRTKLTNTSFYKNSEIVSDVLKVLKDILSTNKDDSKLKLYKERISKLLETSSNSTRKLTEKLFNDLEPTVDGKDVSANVINDALTLISHIFKRRASHNSNKFLELPKDVRILLQGPKGKVVLPYSSSVQDLLSHGDNKATTTTTTTTKSSKAIKNDNNIVSFTVEHVNIHNSDKNKDSDTGSGGSGQSINLSEQQGNSQLDILSSRKGNKQVNNKNYIGETRHDTFIDGSVKKESFNNGEKYNSNYDDNRIKSTDADLNNGGFTIAIMKNGKKIGERKVDDDQVNHYLQKTDDGDSMQSKQHEGEHRDKSDEHLNNGDKTEDNFDVEVVFDKKNDDVDATNGMGTSSYENIDDVAKGHKNTDIDVTRFATPDNTEQISDKHVDLSDKREDMSDKHVDMSDKQEGMYNFKDIQKQSLKKYQLHVDDDLVPKSISFDSGMKKNNLENIALKKKKKKKSNSKKHKTYHDNNDNDDDSYNINDALPFLQIADPSQMTQLGQIPLPPSGGDDEKYIQQLYEPFNPNGMPDFENIHPFEEQASFYRNRKNGFEIGSDPIQEKRSFVYPRVSNHLIRNYGENFDGLNRRRRWRRSLKDDDKLYREKRSDVDDEDDGPHVVKRSAIFSELYQSRNSNSEDAEDNEERDVIRKPNAKKQSLSDDIAEKRSAIKKAISLEDALKRKLLSMKKESSSVLNIIKRVHDDISVGDSKDLRVLEKELSQLEVSKDDSPAQDLTKLAKDSTLRTKVSKKPKGHIKEDPDEYYKYGVTSSGELLTWTLRFYGAGP